MIRKVAEQDREELINMMREFYSSDAVDHSVNADNFVKTFDEIMKDNPYCTAFIIETSNKVAGYAQVSLTYSNEAGGQSVLIEEMFVKDEFQGQGLGKEAFAYIQDTYPDAKRFRLEVTDVNKRAIKLYKNLGYTELEYIQMIKDI